jgi:cardiolipin synthase
MKNWKKEILSIPNILSIFRLLLIPVYILIYLNASKPEDYFISGAILAVSCLTDMIDGKIARKFNMITTLGKILDPLADKATQLTLILCLAIRYPILRVLVALFVIKESFMVIAGCINLLKGKMLKGALISGKICTTVLFASLIILVSFPGLDDVVRHIITAIDAIFMIYALADYATAYAKKGDLFQHVDFVSKKQ